MLKSTNEYKNTAPVMTPNSFKASFAPTARSEPSSEQSAAKPNREFISLPSILSELLYWRTGSNNKVELIVVLIVGVAVDGKIDDDVRLFDGTSIDEALVIEGAGDADDALLKTVGDGERVRIE